MRAIPALIANARLPLFVTGGVLESDTVMFAALVPAVLGVPEITPPLESDNPAGSFPEASDHV